MKSAERRNDVRHFFKKGQEEMLSGLWEWGAVSEKRALGER